MPSKDILDAELVSCAGLDALICVPFGTKADQIIALLKGLKCRPYLAVSAEDALRKLRFNAFNIVIMMSGYSTELVQLLNQKPMLSRRHFFYVYLDSDVETGDPFLAFALSANLVVNSNQIDLLQELLEPALLDYNKLYRVYNNVLKSQENI